ncbi:MAG: phosphoribosylaminoimidazolesuccinocarboxamide synthase [Flavobacteriales bacterium]|jgi:phosphoribosylaminoimidazole-succinocarboxamide synthase|uniref:phosphoribosylaminoimidazolesuccinocarboxamide synthase n=1 Tax=Blattabacterium sp. (Mastotermes darwiniensis) TaxID=39768 RepID=UPI000231DDD7|nr:phosphoribosylaminoimidazolesuccinocarboxamide synthase [Blattabacterium sp. (Mastotermes darwiniensis)]AER40523.1 Phosphoribosylamidoimidazole-succinocarboxamide synthase [Blattabacterium sp. (Mastotermes darwiniensis) str. MADAR]MDR1804963.1 phosphoribosylaminoimidazolesuccinocarboxamide synthase [Flavobacteriales bacterium]
MSIDSSRRKKLSEGKTKKIYATDNPHKIIIHYKDSLTALDGLKNIFLQNKGILNNEITTFIFKFLNSYGIKTHFIRKINEREQLCHKVEIIPLEFVVRNIVSGSMSRRLGIREGTPIKNTIFEIFYKNDVLKDPWINHHHAVFLNIISYEELNKINRIVSRTNDILRKYFLDKNIILVDFKIEFGKDQTKKILLSDEISPDTCRLWDKKTMTKLDKDKFRSGCNEEVILNTYMEIFKRLNENSS